MKKLLFTLLALSIVSTAFGVFRTAEAVIVPAAARTAGAGGTNWQTDITIYNPNNFDVYLTLWYIPSGLTGGYQELALTDPLGAGESTTISDIIGYFAESGSGALFIWGQDAGDFDADIIATSRTWTPDPGDASKAYGQGIPGLPWYYFADPNYAAEGMDHLLIFDLENTTTFRTNVGILNVSDSVTETIQVEILDGAGNVYGPLEYTMGPLSQFQQGNILNQLGLTGSGFMARVSIKSGSVVGNGVPAVMAYGSKVHNVSGDPTYLEAAFSVRPDIDCIWPTN
ncbi:MAG TPA: hypothetical protein PK014_04955 [Thermoanaerobaculia bacterium]|nr:hypothetical protein [Thermoanaerobaculia bacterium]HUM29501.1 hypothetical protein [Thermoanaerobaculia bacterium]HXK67884.1 hypothetical protein [Thermoanaerobaculia bacterium]